MKVDNHVYVWVVVDPRPKLTVLSVQTVIRAIQYIIYLITFPGTLLLYVTQLYEESLGC